MRHVRRVLAALLFFIGVVYAGAIGLLWANESRIVYRTSWTRSWAPLNAPFSPVTVSSTDGLELDAVRVEHPSTSPGARLPADGGRYWLLFFNGAASSIHRGRYREQYQQLYDAGYNVFSIDYRGFGRNAGTPSEAGVYADAAAAYAYLTGTHGVDPSRVILAGRSLGSAVAVDLATRVRNGGVLLLSPIDSVPAVGARLYPWAPVRLLASNQFDSLSKIGRVASPTLIVHARNDRFVPVDVGRALFAEAAGRKRMLETGGGHNSAGFSPFVELAEAMASFWPVAAPPVE